MKKFVGVLVVIFAGTLIWAGGLWAEDFMAGEWTITMVTKIEGMEREMAQVAAMMETMPPEQKAMMDQMMGGLNIQMDVGREGMTTTFTQCLSEENPVPDLKETHGCEMTHTTEGNKTTFQAVCPTSTLAGEITYKKSTMNGVIATRQMIDGKETNATITMTGQYIGPCSE